MMQADEQIRITISVEGMRYTHAKGDSEVNIEVSVLTQEYFEFLVGAAALAAQLPPETYPQRCQRLSCLDQMHAAIRDQNFE